MRERGRERGEEKKVVSNTQEVIKSEDKLNGRFGKQISFRAQTKSDRTLPLLLLLLACWWRWTCVTHAYDTNEWPHQKGNEFPPICRTFASQPCRRPFRLLLIVERWGRTESNIRPRNVPTVCCVAANEAKIQVNDADYTERAHSVLDAAIVSSFSTRNKFSLWRSTTVVVPPFTVVSFVVFIQTHVFLCKIAYTKHATRGTSDNKLATCECFWIGQERTHIHEYRTRTRTHDSHSLAAGACVCVCATRSHIQFHHHLNGVHRWCPRFSYSPLRHTIFEFRFHHTARIENRLGREFAMQTDRHSTHNVPAVEWGKRREKRKRGKSHEEIRKINTNRNRPCLNIKLHHKSQINQRNSFTHSNFGSLVHVPRIYARIVELKFKNLFLCVPRRRQRHNIETLTN